MWGRASAVLTAVRAAPRTSWAALDKRPAPVIALAPHVRQRALCLGASIGPASDVWCSADPWKNLCWCCSRPQVRAASVALRARRDTEGGSHEFGRGETRGDGTRAGGSRVGLVSR